MDQHLLGADLHEAASLGVPVLEDVSGTPASGFVQMALDQ